MKERPILFSGAMVRAILDGRKTQTRRVVKTPAGYGDVWAFDEFRVYPDGVPRAIFHDVEEGEPIGIRCPYGAPGDRLWVREMFRRTRDVDGAEVVDYAAGGTRLVGPGPSAIHGQHRAISAMPRFKPSIHMPRWASRLTLAVETVRVERLHDIGEEDAQAEGIPPVTESIHGERTERDEFARLWSEINGADSWAANPWVWVMTFRREVPNA